MISRPWLAPRRGRASVLATILLSLALGYAALVPGIAEDAATAEQHLGAPRAGEDAPQLRVYADILGIDPVNEALHLRLHATPSRALRDERPGVPGRTVTLRVGEGQATKAFAVRADEPALTATVDVDLDGGRVALYPLERFRAGLRIAAQVASDPARIVPIQLTLWEGIAGWAVRAAEEPGDGAGEVRLRLAIRRSGALAFLALALYALMLLVAGTALTIGGLVFLRVRKIEAALAGALSAMLFALPAMRYALPGSPPLGVLADLLVFLWAELTVALGMLLFVLAWAMGGPRE